MKYYNKNIIDRLGSISSGINSDNYLDMFIN